MSICVSSKYSDAIPVQNLSFKSVSEGLIQIFSRSSYPKEIQISEDHLQVNLHLNSLTNSELRCTTLLCVTLKVILLKGYVLPQKVY